MKDFFNGIGKGAGAVIGAILIIMVLCCSCGACAIFNSSDDDSVIKIEHGSTTEQATTKTTTEANSENTEATEQATTEVISETTEQTTTEITTEEVKEFVCIGDSVIIDDVRFTYISADEFKSTNQFIQPQEGNVFYRIEFEVENLGDDTTCISSMYGFECYADGYVATQTFFEDDLQANLSPNRKGKGALYFEVSSNATEIILEYNANMFIDDITKFKVK